MKYLATSIRLILGLVIITGLTACKNNSSNASDASQEESGATTEIVNRPTGWSEESHSNEVEPNYDVVFPDDKVNQITITITPDEWAAMQSNMTDLFGEAGAGEMGRGFAGGGEMPGGDRPQPGEGQVPENFEPSQGGEPPEIPEDFEPPQGGKQPEMPGGFEPPQDGEQPEMPGGTFAGRAGKGQGGGFGAGDMTPENPMWVSASIEFEGKTWTNVGVRYKGNSSLTSGWRSGTLKLPLKLDFDEFEDEYPEIEDQRFFGFKQLSLANGFSDESFLRDAVTSQILQEAGLPAAETAFYEVILDYGEGPVTLGLYTMIEVIDDTVVPTYFGNNDGNIYDANGSAASFAASTYDQIEESFQKENNEDKADWSDLEDLFNVLHSDQRTSDPDGWREELESVFDVDSFLEWLAISAVIQHWDSYGMMSHNYYLYHNPDTDQLTWISWDHNMVMSAGMGGGGTRVFGGGSRSVSLDKSDINDNWPLIRFLLDDPVYNEQYLNYLKGSIEGPFNPEQMTDTYQSMAELIAPYASADVGEDTFEAAVQQLIDFTEQRVDAVEEFLQSANQ